MNKNTECYREITDISFILNHAKLLGRLLCLMHANILNGDSL